MAKSTKKEQPEVMYIEAVGLQGSGWIQDDTRGTANPIELAGPSKLGIPKTGKRKVKREDGSWYNEDIRHIKDCPFISVAEQKQHGIEPSPDPSADAIFLEKGYGVFVREGGAEGTFDYLKEAYYNESNPERVARATALYRVLKMDEKNEQDIENEMMKADAIKYVGTLYEKRGKVYVYNENKIDGICSLMAIFAESYSGKVTAIQRIAQQRPEWFLDKVSRFEQTTLTEVSHALELNVIGFKVNSVEYKAKDKIICTLGNEKLSNDEKIERFADWLRTSDGHEAYMELKAEIDAAKNKLLQN